MNDLQSALLEIASVINAVYGIATKNTNILSGLFELIGPLKVITSLDWVSLEQQLVGLSDADRQKLESYFVAKLTVADEAKKKLSQTGQVIEQLIGVIRVEIVEFNDVVHVVENVKQIIGV